MKAIEVIITARNRILRTEDRRVLYRDAALALLLGELDNQDAVLGGERNQHHKPDLTVEIEVQSGKLDAEVRPEHADHDRQQHGNRDRPTLVQRDQEQIGEQHGERENEGPV